MTLKKHDRNLFKTIITEHLKYLAKAVMRRPWELSLIGILMFCLIISSNVYAASNVSTMEKDPDTEHALFYDASHNNINPLESDIYKADIETIAKLSGIILLISISSFL